MSNHYCFLAVIVATLTSFSAARAEVILPTGFAAETLAGPDVLNEPMELAFAPGGAAWVTGRAGDIWRIDPATHTTAHIAHIDTDTSGDRGLHGIAFHPDFPTTPHIFLGYNTTNHLEAKYHSRVARWTVTGEGAKSTLDPASEKSLIEFDADQAGQHVGLGLLAHPKERLLYITTGENNQNAHIREYCDNPENKAQSVKDLRGKVLRIGFDGSIPSNNPFAKTPGAQPAVFTRGHRQPWALHFDPPTGYILLAENGGDLTDDYDEVNRIVPGANYGWPKVFGDGWSTLTRTNRIEGFTAPWFAYKRNSGDSCVGAVIYRAPKTGAAYPAKYNGAFFYADFARKSVRSAPIDAKTGKPGESEQFLMGMPSAPLALRLGPDGALYIVTHGGAPKRSTNDTVMRIVWKP